MRELLLSIHTLYFVCIEEIILCIRITNISISINALRSASSCVLKGISELAFQTVVLRDTENTEPRKGVLDIFSDSCWPCMPLSKSLP